MKKLLAVLTVASLMWLAVIYGMDLQAERDRRDGVVDNIPWASYYEDQTWVNVVELMEASDSNDLQLSAIVAREGYRLGIADGEAFCLAAGVQNGRR